MPANMKKSAGESAASGKEVASEETVGNSNPTGEIPVTRN